MKNLILLLVLFAAHLGFAASVPKYVGSFTGNGAGLTNVPGDRAIAGNLRITGTNSLATLSTDNRLTADGSFATSSGWTTPAGWTISGNMANHSTGAGGALTGTANLLQNRMYEVLFDIYVTTPGTGLTLAVGGTDSGLTISQAWLRTNLYVIAGAGGTVVFTPGAGGTFVGSISNLTVRLLTNSTADVVILGSAGATYPVEMRTTGGAAESMAIGQNAGRYLFRNSDDTNVIHFGGNLSTFVGNNAAKNSANILASSAFGAYVQSGNTVGIENNGFGASAQQNGITASYGCAFGNDALSANLHGWYNNAYGFQSQGFAMGSNNNTFGVFSGYGIASAENVAMGHYALKTGPLLGYDRNIALGAYSSFLGTRFSRNVGIGNHTFYVAEDSSNNVAVGSVSASALRLGSGNTFVGVDSGSALVSGNTNILIGPGVQATATNSSSELNIGNLIYGNLGTQLVGIAKTNPSVALDVTGAITASGTVTGGAVTTAGNITGSGDVRAGNFGAVYWSGRSYLYSPASGWVNFSTSGGNFNGLIFGPGSTAATQNLSTNYPSLYMESTTNWPTLSVRIGTNVSAGTYGSLVASNLTAGGTITATNGVFAGTNIANGISDAAGHYGNGAGLTNLSFATNASRLVGVDAIIGDRQYAFHYVATNGISNAVLAASSATATARAVVIVTNGTYTEWVDTTSPARPWVDIVGESKAGVIWQWTNNANDTLKCGGGNNLVANMTIRHSASKYAVHAESGTSSLLNMSTLVFSNCKLIGDGTTSNPSLGAGLYGSQRLYMLNCELYSDDAAAMFIHNQATQTTPAEAWLISCVLRSTNSNGLTIQSQASGQSDVVSVAGGLISAPLGVDILTQNSGAGAGEIVLAVSTNDYYATTFSTMQLTNATKWVKSPLFPALLPDVRLEKVDRYAAQGTAFTIKSGGLQVGSTNSPYTGMKSAQANIYGANGTISGLLNLTTTNARATDVGGALGLGGENSIGAAGSTLFARISGVAELGGTYHGNLRFQVADGGAASLTEALRITSGSLLTVPKNFAFSTNSGASVSADFRVQVQLLATNAAFAFLLPLGVNTYSTNYQQTIFFVTNSTAAAVAITAPATVNLTGTALVTNLTRVQWECYAGRFTNADCRPIF